MSNARTVTLKARICPTPSENPYPTANERPDCFICNRGGLGMMYLGWNRYRHEDCAPGSRNWCEWYDGHPEGHTVEGDILRQQVKV